MRKTIKGNSVNRYRRGVYYERKALHELKSEGAMVVRSARSGGYFDIWAVTKNHLKLIQVKSTMTDSDFVNIRKELKKIRVPNFCRVELWIWRNRWGWEKIVIK